MPQEEGEVRISDLDEQLQARPTESHPTEASPLQEDVNRLAFLVKAQKAVEITETEVGRLKDELWQYSDREKEEMQEKLQEETSAHQWTGEAFNQRLYLEGQAEWKILEMREDAKKQKQWFKDQLAS